MKHYGIIGFPLSHSFSPGYFNRKFENESINAEYSAYPLSNISEFKLLIHAKKMDGINVTIPYKEAVIPYLDELDITAQEVGAVNTIKITDSGIKGYNTDVDGFEKSLLSFIGHPEDISGALVLGTGGASKAVQYVLRKLNIPFVIVSRNTPGQLTYQNITSEILEAHPLIINTTPLGMYPNTASKPDIPYSLLNEKYFLYDLVYNPEKTLFLSEGLKHGSLAKNGHDMLILQAEKAWEIWNQSEI